MPAPLVSVIESRTYLAKAATFMSDAERDAVVDMLAATPQCGAVIPGGGGIRKVPIGLAGRGKRGGARVIYYFHDTSVPLLIITVFAKNQKADLSRAELEALGKAGKVYAEQWRT